MGLLQFRCNVVGVGVNKRNFSHGNKDNRDIAYYRHLESELGSDVLKDSEMACL